MTVVDPGGHPSHHPPPPTPNPKGTQFLKVPTSDIAPNGVVTPKWEILDLPPYEAAIWFDHMIKVLPSDRPGCHLSIDRRHPSQLDVSILIM